MRRLALVLAVVTMAGLLAACTGWQQAIAPAPLPVEMPAPLPTATPRPPGEPALVAYDYVTRDAGDGWYVGTAQLWVQNPFDTWVPPALPPQNRLLYDVRDAYVETSEGKTYPAKITTDSTYEHSEGTIDLRSMPGLPPGFRFAQGLTELERMKMRDYVWGKYTIEFRYAGAAHPTTVRFPSQPDWAINLADAVKPAPTQPTDLPATSFQSINALDNKVILDQPGKLLITLGKCQLAQEASGRAGYFTFKALNRDQLDDASVIVPFPARAFVLSGQGIWFVDETPVITVGPGQELQGRIKIFSLTPKEATHLIVYWPDGNYQVYSTADCGR